MCSIKANDILDELLSENNRILNELMFAKDLVECLQRLRKCLIDFNSKCDCLQNSDNKTYFRLIDHKYKQLMRNRPTNQSSNDCQSLYRSLCNVQIKQEPEDPIRLPDERGSKRAAEEGVKRQTKQKKRKSVTFNESNNVINEFAVESEVEETENQLFSDIFEEQFLTIKCDKLSTNLSRDEISRKVANDECIARIDSENKFVKIFCSSAYSITTGPSDESIFGFGCRLCNYISNRKNHIKFHILKTHNKENQINNSSKRLVNSQPTSSSLREAKELVTTGDSVEKMSTKYGLTEIKDMLDHKLATALSDPSNETIIIYYMNNGVNPCNESMIGFGCRLCDFVSNRKISLKKHISAKHQTHETSDYSGSHRSESIDEKRISISANTSDSNDSDISLLFNDTQSGSEWNDHSISVLKTDQNNEQQSEESNLFSIESLIERVQKHIPSTNDECGTSEASSLEKSGATESSENLSNDESEDEFSTSLGDDITEVISSESDSDSELQEIDDPSDFDWASEVIKKKKKTKNKIVKKSNEIGPQMKANKSKVIMLVSEIQDKMSKNECRIETSENNHLIKLIFLSDESSKSPIGYICGWIGCEKVFAIRKSLNKHIGQVHEKTDRFKCEFEGCTYRGNSVREFAIHRTSHLGSELTLDYIKQLSCDTTQKSSTTSRQVNKASLQALINANDLIESIDETNELIKIYRLKPTTGSGESNRIVGFGCNHNDCKVVQTERQKMIEHINRHLGVRPYSCNWPACEYSGVSASALKRHKDVHEDIRPYACEWPGCEQRCRKRSRLKEHMLTHGSERPFKCDWPQCDKRFRSESCCRAHQVTHTRDKKMQCSWPGCLSTFRDNAGLKNHEMIHRGIWPFDCLATECSKKFRQKTQMIIHFRKHHPEQIQLLNELK